MFRCFHNFAHVFDSFSEAIFFIVTPFIFTRRVRIAIPKEQDATPCNPSPCGPNAECRERNGAGACFCHAGFEGNPYDGSVGCRRECDTSADCADKLACVRYKCVDPCIGICGTYAICNVENHVPTCTCPTGYTGDPFRACKQAPPTPRK